MSKGSRVREVLEQMAKYIRHRSHVSPNNYDLYKKEGIDKVLSDLAEIVREYARIVLAEHIPLPTQNSTGKDTIVEHKKLVDLAVTDIAKLFAEEEE